MATTYDSDGSAEDIQAKIDGATFGDTVTIPAGIHSITAGITCAKGILIRGAGGGRVEGASKTSLAIGTGSKAFTIHKQTLPDSSVLSSVIVGFTTGETVRATYKADGTQYMEGTVTAYDGDTLTLNVTSTSGSGTYAAWNFVVDAETTLVHDAGTDTLMDLTEDTSASIDIADLRIASGTGTGYFIRETAVENGKPIIWHDSRASNTGSNHIIRADYSRGLIYRVYWDTGFRWLEGANNIIPGYGLTVKDDSNPYAWLEESKMGMDDTDGRQNFYAEDCFFAGLVTETFDADGSARLVVRRSVFDSSGLTSHGADTGPIGQRHMQIYRNLWVFDDLGSDTAGMDYAITIRGGTGVVAHNYIPNISSSHWGDKLEVKLQCQQLQRNAGPNAGWGSGDGGVPNYPCPRQVGMGRVTGLGGNDSVTYAGDAEPLYFWGNGGTFAIGLSDGSPADVSDPDSTADYIVEGRDYITDGTAKPDWTEYTYPHPIRAEETPEPDPDALTGYTLTNPSELFGRVGTASGTFTITATGGEFTGSESITITCEGATITPSVGSADDDAVTVTPADGATGFTFTITPTASGTLSIVLTNSEGFPNPE